MFFDQSSSFIVEMCCYIPQSRIQNLVLIESIFVKVLSILLFFTLCKLAKNLVRRTFMVQEAFL